MITLSNKSIEQFEKFISTDPKTFYRFTLSKIGKAIDGNKNVVVLMVLESNKVASVKKVDYETGLTKAMEHFVEIEDYESAKSCRDYINKLRIEEVIKG